MPIDIPTVVSPPASHAPGPRDVESLLWAAHHAEIARVVRFRAEIADVFMVESAAAAALGDEAEELRLACIADEIAPVCS